MLCTFSGEQAQEVWRNAVGMSNATQYLRPLRGNYVFPISWCGAHRDGPCSNSGWIRAKMVWVIVFFVLFRGILGECVLHEFVIVFAKRPFSVNRVATNDASSPCTVSSLAEGPA